MNNQIETQARTYWEKTWNRFLKYHGMIAPSAKLVQHLFNHVPRHGVILDLGCGEGRNSLYLSQVGFSIIGVDLSFKASRVMKNNFFEEELKGLVLTADARNLPIASDSLDGILAHHLFDHLDQHSFTEAVDEAFRVLKPEGVMLLTMDSFSEMAGDNNAIVTDDGSIIYVKGSKKGMLVRPYREDELAHLEDKGWQFIKNEITPRRSKIMLLRKCRAVS
ncbi:MAG TPA: methyltransferase domain-containing protein [Candidatus Rifleibacterium sp.]|mgnify:CR=1 FL=1|nr:methyltransferase domain-containing protein [Candidatus Rifleibacterium sp.]HPT45690.1 methyltransferase domain-containing protein [Candidatus Rifleibacterium sp.]